MSPEASSEPLHVDRRDDGVVLLTLDVPALRNAMTAPLTEAWATTIAGLRDDRDVRCVVVTGAGPAFCSGGDTSWIGSEPDASVDQLRERMLPFYRTWLSIRELEAPTIAAVNGPAIGAGTDLACMCDIRIAGERARFAESFIALGLVPGDGGAWFLPQVVGAAVAAEMSFTGDALDAQAALRCGLVSRVVPDLDLLASAHELAGRIARHSGTALRLTKRLLREGRHASLDTLLDLSASYQAFAHATPEHRAAVNALFAAHD